jgi:GT2 family glycosyltransferase
VTTGHDDGRRVERDVTVVIPTTGGAVIDGCLGSIAAGTAWPARLVVVEQGSGSNVATSLEALRGAGVETLHVRSDQTGIAAATNRGIEAARTPYVAVTHDDCRVDVAWLERLAASMRGAGEAIVTGRVVPEGDGIVLTVKTDSRPATYSSPQRAADVLFPPNMGFPVGIVRRVGPFDEHPSLATAGEDNEWAHRALRRGVPIVYDPAAVVAHLARYRVDELPAVYERYARGQGAFYGTWLRRGDPLIVWRAGVDVVRAPWLLLRGAVARNEDLVAMGRGALRGLVPGLVAGLRNPGVRSTGDR